MFIKGDLVWRMASNARKKDGKFSTNWEGSYRIREDVGGGTYRLELLSGEEIPNTWVFNTCNPGCTFFPHLTFFPKEGFGQGVFNEAPQTS